MDAAFGKPVVPLVMGRKRGRSEARAAVPAVPASLSAPPPPPAPATEAPPGAAVPRERSRTPGSRRAVRGAARPPLSADPRAGRTIFMGNLPVATSRSAVARFVEASAGVGTVESVRFRSVPVAKLAVAPGSGFRAMIRAAVATGSLNSARDSMNAYVVLRGEGAVAPALRLNGAAFEGRHLRVDAVGGGGCGEGGGGGDGAGEASGGAGASGAPRYDHKRTVFVGNLPFDAGEEAVRHAFERCGAGGALVSVEAVRIVRDRATLMGKGFCFVLFRERAGVLDALGLHGAKVPALGGRPLRVVRCSADGKPLGGKHAAGTAAGKNAGAAGGGGGASSSMRAPAALKKKAIPAAVAHMGLRGETFAAKARPKLPEAKGLVVPSKKGKWKKGKGEKRGRAPPQAAGGAAAAAPLRHKKAHALVEGWAAAAAAVSK